MNIISNQLDMIVSSSHLLDLEYGEFLEILDLSLDLLLGEH